MRYFSWVMIAIGVACLIYHLFFRYRARAEGRALPVWTAGDIAGDLAFLCVALSMLLREDDTLTFVFSVSSLLLLTVAITQTIIARRRAAADPRANR